MNATSILFSALFSVVFLFGCQGPVDPDPVAAGTGPVLPLPLEEAGVMNAEPVAAGRPRFMTITVIRIEERTRYEPELLITVRGELVAAIGNQSYAVFDLPVGTNTLTFDWENTPLKFDEELILDPQWSEPRFFSVVHKFDVPDIARNAKDIDYTMMETLALFELPAKYGKEVVKNLDPELSYVFDYPRWWELEE